MSREFKGCSIAFALLQPFFNTTGPFFDWLTFIRLGLVEITQLELVEFTRRTTATNRAEKTVIIGKISPLSQLLLRYEEKYFRSIRAHFTGLCYHSFKDRWQPIGGFILGHPSVLSILPLPDGSYDFGTILYMTEDTADSPEELQPEMNDPDAIIFDCICEEVFGDG